MTTVLIQLDNGTAVSCHGWDSAVSSAVCRVVITASANDPGAARDAEVLRDHLLAALRDQYAVPSPPPCHPYAWPATACRASGVFGAMRRVLVWVAGRSANAPVVPLTGGGLGGPWSSIVTLLPSGTPPTALPPAAAARIAWLYDPGSVQAAVPFVMAASGLAPEQFKVFISYRWDDSRAFADQLFHELSKNQFDVYLDRFRTMPGTDFMQRIRAELIDKACVVLLDSRDVGSSHWVRGEYAFARTYRLGLMAIDLPGGVKTFPRIGARLDLRRSTRKPFSGSDPLPPKAVAAALEFVRANYHVEAARRYRHQRLLITTSASLTGLPVQVRPDGLVETLGRLQQDYVFAASAGPPSIASFRAACSAAGTHAKGVVIGPTMAQMHQAHADVRWLAKATGSVLIDERKVYAAMRQAVGGTL